MNADEVSGWILAAGYVDEVAIGRGAGGGRARASATSTASLGTIYLRDPHVAIRSTGCYT